MDSITVPAKVFLIGEYSVLQGGAALLVMLKPGFTYIKNAKAEPPNPLSPYGQYQKERLEAWGVQITKGGLGPGFGSSTAELIAGAAIDQGRLPETRAFWDWYQGKFPKASGADLVGQLETMKSGLPLVHIEKDSFHSLPAPLAFKNIFLYSSSAKAKIKTHEALEKKLPNFNLELCNGWKGQVECALQSGEVSGLLVLNQFADYLSALGLETERAKKIRQVFAGIPSVVAAKGCGAGLNDVFLVVTKSDFVREDRVMLDRLAQDCELTALGTLAEHLW